MKNKEIKQMIIQEFEDIRMKDIKDNLLEDIQFVCQVEEEPKRKPRNHVIFSCLCLSFAIVLSFIAFNKPQYECLVSLDVNPSIELEINDEARVIDVLCHNQDAIEVLDEMDLIKTDIDVAINALIGSMFRHGYINEAKNSVLVTVQGDNQETRQKMKERVVEDVKTALNGYSLEASVISQDIEIQSDANKLAKEYDISVGKATLIQELVKENPDYQFEDLTALSISDLNTLVHFKNIEFKTISIEGIESHDGYLTKEEVKERVLLHSKVQEKDLTDYQYDLDCQKNRLIYIVKFSDSYGTYHYTINAISGEIITFELDNYMQ